MFLEGVVNPKALDHDAYPALSAQVLQRLLVLYKSHTLLAQTFDRHDPFCRNPARPEDLALDVSVVSGFLDDMNDLEYGREFHDVGLCHRCGNSDHVLRNDCHLGPVLCHYRDTTIQRQEEGGLKMWILQMGGHHESYVGHDSRPGRAVRILSGRADPVNLESVSVVEDWVASLFDQTLGRDDPDQVGRLSKNCVY